MSAPTDQEANREMDQELRFQRMMTFRRAVTQFVIDHRALVANLDDWEILGALAGTFTDIMSMCLVRACRENREQHMIASTRDLLDVQRQTIDRLVEDLQQRRQQSAFPSQPPTTGSRN